MTTADNSSGKPGFFARLRQRFSGNGGLGLGGFAWLRGRTFDDELEEEIEERLLLADTGVAATARILAGLRRRVKTAADVPAALRDELTALLQPHEAPLVIPDTPRPFVVLLVGVNGSGKTTTIGKLARRLLDQGHTVLLAAGDTYRAAATEQLQVWGERNGVPVIAQQQGADPAAVIFDAIEAARARAIDVVLADTAGRLQNQDGLMRELEKVVRVAGKQDPTAPHEKMLVVDASLGQNALVQARQFHAAIGITGITLTKLDGGSRGGTLLAIAQELDVPFRFVGIGEQAEDMDVFKADAFVAALLAEPGTDDTSAS
jgi:fused signal recognition particle receptor